MDKNRYGSVPEWENSVEVTTVSQHDETRTPDASLVPPVYQPSPMEDYFYRFLYIEDEDAEEK